MGKRILYTVLDWGLGHATRSIPIINGLRSHGCEVVMASDNMALEYLRREFPQLKAYSLPSYGVTYSYRNLMGNALKNSKNIAEAMLSEQRVTNQLVASENIDAIVSDNRYGCYSKSIPSAIVTHQLKFRTGNSILDKATQVMVKKWLTPFDAIWIPDNKQRSLSGVISETSDPRARYIGWQSTVTSRGGGNRFKLVAILSGPEPQRSNLENEVRPQLEAKGEPCVLVRGVSGFDEPRQKGNLTIYDHLDRKSIDRLMGQTTTIFCRTGYSSLMDLACAGMKAILVPTPAQPEQLHLG